MQNKPTYVLLLLLQVVLGKNNTGDDKLVNVQQSKDVSEIVENITDTQSFEKIKEEILQFMNLTRNDIIKELQLIRGEIKTLPQIENLHNITTKLETLATSNSVDKLSSMVSTEAVAIHKLANETCTGSQGAFGSALSEKLSTLASKDDIQSITSITENYSNMLEYDIGKLKDHFLNSSSKLNNIDYVVTSLNNSLEFTAVQLKSIKRTVNDNHKTMDSIRSKFEPTLSNITTGIDQIGLQMENVVTESDIKQLYTRLINLSTTEALLLRNMKDLFHKFLNSTKTDKQLSEAHSKDEISELVKENGIHISSLYENIKNIGATINATGISIKHMGESFESFKHIYENSIKLIYSISNTVNTSHTLLSNVELVVKYINSNTALIPNAVMQRLGFLTFDVKELKKKIENISVKQIVEQISEYMSNTEENEMTSLQSIQQNLSNTVNNLVIAQNMSLVLAKLNDLAKETKNDTTMVDFGIYELNVAFEKLMFQLTNFEMTIDNVQSDILEIKGSLDNDNKDVILPNHNFERLESTIYSMNGTLSTVMSVIQTIDTDLGSCISNISLVKNKFDEVHTDIDLIGGGIVSANSSIYTLDKKILNITELINPMVSKLDKLDENVLQDNKDLAIVNKTVNLINEKIEIIDKISKTDKYVYESLQNMNTSILDIKENTENMKSFTSEAGDGISNIQSSIQLMNNTIKNLQNTVSSINYTTNLIKVYTEPCRPPYSLLADQCITVFETQKTWMNAKAHCSSLGLQFLEVKEESIGSITKFLHDRYNDDYHIWIGASDIETEGKFLWTTGKTVDLTWGWGIGQPNDWKEGEDCVELCSVHDEQMNDMSCDELYYFACEKL